MITCHDSYIISVKRREECGQTTVEGQVEIVGEGDGAKTFRTMEELWDILGKAAAGEWNPER